MKNERGQVVLILVLVMTVALAIGISVIQRSLSDISTSSKVEQSSRAFSAAEAGIERALGTGLTTLFTLENNSSAAVTGTNDLLPVIPSAGNRQNPLEYPPLAKEEVAHVWLIANLDDVNNPPAQGYNQSTLDVYWGKSGASDKAALELTLVYHDGTSYQPKKWYLDNASAGRSANNFDTTSPDCSEDIKPTGFENTYQCKIRISLPSGRAMLLRARLLYNTTSQPFAVQSAVDCPASGSCTGYSITPQARILTSTGSSGATQRKVRLFQILKVVPPYFDYAIFSSGEISK